ncbi:guanine-1-methyltransferase-domain-containing protein [Crucibulum laeve]|uniref:tRNA (guanine(9)-N1)-methyltransferase n=1 Tax=Crucibulum laeve TaxID=68775 RepID=A0A5C3MRC6_9AGAR|nr:guanine-1-methyltransferase-domain-containing protein [Crucibulum laeve]
MTDEMQDADATQAVVSDATGPSSQTDLYTTPSTTTVPDIGELKTLSKSALKKAAKAERFAALKIERRAREKEAKKEKKRVRAEKRATGELDDDEEERNRQKKRPRLQFGGKVVVDLGFDEMMNEKEISSLCSQLAYTYSANRQSSFPFSLIYTSLNGRTFDRLESMNEAGYKRWIKTQWWNESYEGLWLGKDSASSSKFEAASVQESSSAVSTAQDSQDTLKTQYSRQPESAGIEHHNDVQKKVVYLTADSEDELTELKADEIYIIGGICDHNRYKNLCLNKAKASGIRTARLPIGRYLASLPTRKVLTVNQVFEILLKWVETKDWEESFYSVIPKRKFQAGGKDKSEDTKGEGEKDVEIDEGQQKNEGEVAIPVQELEQA